MNLRFPTVALMVIALDSAGCGSSSSSSSSRSTASSTTSTTVGFERIPLEQGPELVPGATVQQTPQGPVVGQGTCFYWLHTHTTDGVLHIESPTARIYTLGNFFDIWGQPLNGNQVGPAKGKVTAIVKGRGGPKIPARFRSTRTP